MLVLWLLELMLRKLGSLKDAGIQPDSPQYRTSWDVLNRFTEQKRIMVFFGFSQFTYELGMNSRNCVVQECIRSNLGAVYSLLSSHGMNDVLLHLAGKLKVSLESYVVTSRCVIHVALVCRIAIGFWSSICWTGIIKQRLAFCLKISRIQSYSTQLARSSSSSDPKRR